MATKESTEVDGSESKTTTESDVPRVAENAQLHAVCLDNDRSAWDRETPLPLGDGWTLDTHTLEKPHVPYWTASPPVAEQIAAEVGIDDPEYVRMVIDHFNDTGGEIRPTIVVSPSHEGRSKAEIMEETAEIHICDRGDRETVAGKVAAVLRGDYSIRENYDLERIIENGKWEVEFEGTTDISEHSEAAQD